MNVIIYHNNIINDPRDRPGCRWNAGCMQTGEKANTPQGISKAQVAKEHNWAEILQQLGRLGCKRTRCQESIDFYALAMY